MAAFPRFLWLWGRKLPTGGCHKIRQEFPLVDVLHQKIWLRPIVGRGRFQVWSHTPSRFGDLDKELIIANKGKYFSVTIQSVFTEHLSKGDRPRVAHLVSRVLDKFQFGRHLSFPAFRRPQGALLNPLSAVPLLFVIGELLQQAAGKLPALPAVRQFFLLAAGFDGTALAPEGVLNLCTAPAPHGLAEGARAA